jgi:hypothetical protein
MNKLCILVATAVLGYLGWSAGDVLGFGFFGAFLASSLGSLLGVWAGWKIARHLER